jgi:hypothetical protein
MSRHDHYVTFPVWLLRTSQSPLLKLDRQTVRNRLDGISEFCVNEMQQHLRRQAATERDATEPTWSMFQRIADDEGFDVEADFDELVAVAARQTLGMGAAVKTTGNGMAAIMAAAGDATTGRKLTRIRADILDAARAGRMSWRDFCILAAIYAVCYSLKDAKAGRASCQQLAAMAAGYGGQKQADDAGVALLKPHQVRQTVAKLQRAGWFARVPIRRGQYFSNRLSQSQLESWVAQVEASRQFKREQTGQQLQGRQIRHRVAEQTAARLEQLRQQQTQAASSTMANLNRGSNLNARSNYEPIRNLPPDVEVSTTTTLEHSGAGNKPVGASAGRPDASAGMLSRDEQVRQLMRMHSGKR